MNGSAKEAPPSQSRKTLAASVKDIKQYQLNVMNRIQILTLATIQLFYFGCSSLKPVTAVQREDISKYKYFYITPTQTISSIVGTAQYGMTNQTINPSDIISGVLLKQGFIRLPELKPELATQTAIINYGESGRRPANLGYTIEVTIQFTNASTNLLIGSCTAEGQGLTEVNDIHQAISRCLNSLLKPN